MGKAPTTREFSHHFEAKIKKGEPGPDRYSSNEKIYRLAKVKSIPSVSMGTEPRFRTIAREGPDAGTYTPKLYQSKGQTIGKPTSHPPVTLKFFQIRRAINGNVGPQTYDTYPGPLKNGMKFQKGLRRYRLSQHVEAMDKKRENLTEE